MDKNVFADDTDTDTDGLRYLDASAVECPCPAGNLDGLNLCSQDNEKLGVIDGVLIDPVNKRLRYFVVEAAKWFKRNHYLVPADTPAVVVPEDRALRVNVPFTSIARQKFESGSVQRFSDDDLMTAMFSRTAA